MKENEEETPKKSKVYKTFITAFSSVTLAGIFMLSMYWAGDTVMGKTQWIINNPSRFLLVLSTLTFLRIVVGMALSDD